jgi:predicted nuclease with RNAse H fold
VKNNKKEFFIGIDLGGKKNKTTGICILKNQKIVLIKDVLGESLLKIINPYLSEAKVIAIDAPLTLGKGKGLMRLYEKFLSKGIFRKEKVSPVPPALMPEFRNFALETAEKLAKKGFSLGINLIETFPAFIRKIYKQGFYKTNSSFKNENQESAFLCAQIAFLHSQFKTRWLGYKDGFLFLPEMSFWKPEWREIFYQAWQGRERLKYHHLITNVFQW